MTKTDAKTAAKTAAKSDAAGLNGVPLPALATGLLIAVLVAFGLHAFFIAGPAQRAAAREDLAQTIAAEDRDICQRLGISATDAAFATCRNELAIVRQKQADRDTAAAEGVL